MSRKEQQHGGVNLNGPEYCRKQVEAIWKQGG